MVRRNRDNRLGQSRDEKEVASEPTTKNRGPVVLSDEIQGQAKRGGSGMNIRQANGLGRVHVAMPQMKQTYCGRQIDEEDWITTSKEANCTGCARAGAPRPEDTRR